MTPSHLNNRDMADSRRAIIRAAKRAADDARRFNLPLILWRDGQVVEVMPDDLPPLPEQAPVAGEEEVH